MLQSIANLGLQLLGIGVVLNVVGMVGLIVVGFYLAAKEEQRRASWMRSIENKH